MDKNTKFAHLGKPGTAFTPGFKRRLDMITKRIDLRDKKVLDVGCGEGVWLEQFAKYAGNQNVFGSDIDKESLQMVSNEFPKQNLKLCPAEELDFADDSFDVVFSNEVLEHVKSDRKSLEEMVRVVKRGGKIIFFTPNRGWPFEQHGMFRNGKYYWGNVLLLPWLPKSFQKKYAPHVRNYWNSDIKKLYADLPVKVELHTHIFPGFDGLSRKYGIIGRGFKSFMHLLEKTPLSWFGISHYVILQKTREL